MPFEPKNMYPSPRRNWKKQEQNESKSPLEIAARKARIETSFIPKEGSVAYDRLLSACEEYIEHVENQLNKKPRLGGRPSPHEIAMVKHQQQGRREAHGQVCSILYGKTYNELSYDERRKAADFAALAVGKKELRALK